MNKLDYFEYKKLDGDSRKEWKQKASDKLKAENEAVFDALQQIDTDLNNLAKKYGDEFRKAIKEFHKLLQGLDTRGINKVELLPSSDTYITTSTEPDKKWARAENFSVERLALYNSDIRFKVTSSNGGWSCPITISKTLTRPATREWAREGDEERIPDNERKFDKLDTPVTFDAFNTTAKEDADAFVKGLNIGSFTNFISDINKINKDYRANKSVLKTQGYALYSRIVKLQSNSRNEIDKHLKKLIKTEGLIRPKRVQDNSWYKNKGKFVITSRSNGEDGYLQPYKLKVKTNSWEYYDDLECELTFTNGYTDVVMSKTTTLQLPKKDVERWISDLFIIKYGGYSHTSFQDNLSYYDNALNSLDHMPRLNSSVDAQSDWNYSYSLNGNKKERALRDSFGEWVEEPRTEVVEA